MTYWFTEPGKEDIRITKSYSLLNDSVEPRTVLVFYICLWFHLVLETSPKGGYYSHFIYEEIEA